MGVVVQAEREEMDPVAEGDEESDPTPLSGQVSGTVNRSSSTLSDRNQSFNPSPFESTALTEGSQHHNQSHGHFAPVAVFEAGMSIYYTLCNLSVLNIPATGHSSSFELWLNSHPTHDLVFSNEQCPADFFYVIIAHM